MGRHTLHDTRHPPCSSCVTLKRSLLSRQCEEEEEEEEAAAAAGEGEGGAGRGRWAMGDGATTRSCRRVAVALSLSCS